MIKFSGGGGGAEVVTPSNPSPLQTTFAFTHPLFKDVYLERSLNDPHHPTSSILHYYAFSIHHHPSPTPSKNVDHTYSVVDFGKQNSFKSEAKK